VVKDNIGVVPLFVRLNHKDINDVVYIPLEGAWIYHDDEAIDLAVTLFESTENTLCDFEPVDINFVFYPSALNYPISEGETVAFVGLLTKHPGEHRNTPIYRYGHLAMMVEGKLEGR
jgi:hypothetical protein